MDPALCELIEEGSEQDEVSVIIRLKGEARIPPDVRVISRFGKIATVRLRRGDIHSVYATEDIASMKASRDVVSLDSYEDFAESTVGLNSTLPSSDARAGSVPEDGTGVVVGICDWGFDFTHENFRNADGTTRFLALWDQSAESDDPPMPYGYGRVYTREEINKALATSDPPSTLGYHPSKGDPLGTGAHGTHVLDILAGNRREPGSEVGLASGSEIVCVHLATERMRVLENFGDSVRLLEGLDFLRHQAGKHPLVMHLSAGKTGGEHRGTALFEQAVDALLLENPGIVLGQSVGNYAASRMHTHGRIGPDQEHVLHWLISSRDRTPNELEIWYSGLDRFDLTLIAPNGARFAAELGENVKLTQDDTHWGTMYHRQGEPNSGMNHIDIFLRTTSPPGRYRIVLRGHDVVDGRFHAWIERDAGGPHQSRFPRRQATSHFTTNTICNSFHGIAVGAYDATAIDRPPTLFSSRGPTADGRQKPELVAPGYRIRAARSMPAGGWNGESRLTVKSGTSMAAPSVSGTMVLMMQAAGRPMTIAEVRRVLIGTADPISGLPGRSSTRLGYGYLNTAAAVEAARRLGRGSAEQEQDVASGYEELSEPSAEWAPHWVVDPQPFEYGSDGPLPIDGEESSYAEAEAEEWDVVASDETGFNDEEDGAVLVESDAQWGDDELAPEDEGYNASIGNEVSRQEEYDYEDEDEYEYEGNLSTDEHAEGGEESNYVAEDLEDWDINEENEAGFEDEEDTAILVESSEPRSDDIDLDSEAEDYNEPAYNEVSRQEVGRQDEDDEEDTAVLVESSRQGDNRFDLSSEDQGYNEMMAADFNRQEEEEEEAYRLTELYEALGELAERGYAGE